MPQRVQVRKNVLPCLCRSLTEITVAYFMEQLRLGDVPSIADTGEAVTYTSSENAQAPGVLDAHSEEYKKANLQYDATKEDWSLKGLGLTDDNLPLLYPDSTISDEEMRALFAEGDSQGSDPAPNPTSQLPPGMNSFLSVDHVSNHQLIGMMSQDQWSGPNGPVKKGSFQFFVKPIYSQPHPKRRRYFLAAREDSASATVSKHRPPTQALNNFQESF